MQEITSVEQINLIQDRDDDVPFFDRDNWKHDLTYNETFPLTSVSQIPMVQKLPQELNETEVNMISRFEQEIAASKQNFFRISIEKKVNKNKITLSKVVATNKSTTSRKNIESNDKYEAFKNPRKVLKQGFMEKKTDGFFFQWNIRYLVLTPEKLYIFETAKKEKVVGCINLKVLPTTLKKNKANNNLTLDFEGQCENMLLRVEDNKQYDDWTAWIERVITFQSKQNKLFLQTLTKPLYDAKDTLTEAEFLEYAQTGDILLFHTRHAGAKLQRVITNSNYDHVAMIVRFRQNQVLVFESNPIDGVSVYEWNMFIKYFSLYEQVTIRKLNTVKKSDLNHHFLTFARKNIGKKYDISALKLIKAESDFDWGTAKQQINERGYFCSQLIAKAYKTAGLLGTKKSSAKYWPVDFSQKGQMKLVNGACLGSQQVIILNKHMKKKNV